MKDLIPKIILVLMIGILSAGIGYISGKNSLDGTITIQDLESIQKIPGISNISIYSWHGNWEIQFDYLTKCGKTRIRSGDQPTLKAAIGVAKVGASCFDSCGGGK